MPRSPSSLGLPPPLPSPPAKGAGRPDPPATSQCARVFFFVCPTTAHGPGHDPPPGKPPPFPDPMNATLGTCEPVKKGFACDMANSTDVPLRAVHDMRRSGPSHLRQIVEQQDTSLQGPPRLRNLSYPLFSPAPTARKATPQP